MAIEFPRRSGRVAQRPEMFENWAPRFPDTHSAISTAVMGLVKGYRSVSETHAQLGRDESSTAGARLLKSARHARTKLEPLMEALDAAVGNARGHVDQLKIKVREAYRPPNPTTVEFAHGQEIREHFKTLAPAQAAQQLEEAKRDGDMETLTAIAAYQRYLSKVPADLQKWARDELIEARAPEQAKMLSALEEQIGLAETFRAEMLSSVAEMIDMQRAQEIELAAKVDAA